MQLGGAFAITMKTILTIQIAGAVRKDGCECLRDCTLDYLERNCERILNLAQRPQTGGYR